MMNLETIRTYKISDLQSYSIALASGLFAGLAFAPFNITPVLWFSFPILFLLLKAVSSSSRATFFVGWSFAFGYFLATLHWLVGSLFVDIQKFWWVLPFAAAGLPALIALIYGFAVLLWRRLDTEGVSSVFIFAFCWFLAESARSHLFTGFPWDTLGYAWNGSLAILQITYLIGIEGLTFLTLMLAVLPTLFFIQEDKRKAALALFAGLLIISSLYVWGSVRLASASYDAVPGVRLRLVQPDLPPFTGGSPQLQADSFEKLMNLTFDPKGLGDVTHFVWPETATSYYLAEEESIRAYIGDILADGSVLLAGTTRRTLREGQRPLYYNSLIAMNDAGHVVAGYDKHHLVPFGEYIPFNKYFGTPISAITGAEFTPGAGIRTVRAPGLPPFSSLICYEGIFPGEVIEKEDPPELLVNITNDAWFNGTIGPAQHYAIARVRAIEEGLPMIRVANRGITAVIDGYGRPWALTDNRAAGFVDSDLPKPIR